MSVVRNDEMEISEKFPLSLHLPATRQHTRKEFQANFVNSTVHTPLTLMY
jgi:hypothetical protein